MAMAIDGLVSNLQTTELINALMQAEAVPQTLLKSTLSSTKDRNSALQTLNSLVASVKTAAATAAKPDALKIFKTSSSSSDVTAAATSGAAAGSITFNVEALAKAQVSVTAAATDWTGGSTLTVTRGDGSAPVEISPLSSDLRDVAAAINDAGAGLSASAVRVGVDASGKPLYRLQVTAEETGAANSFSLWAGTAGEVAAGTATDVLAEPGAATITAASDASLVLWKGSSAEARVTSSTNTFSSLMTGVDVTVGALTADPVTVTVSANTAAASSVFAALTSAVGKALDYVDSNTTVTTTIGTDGKSKTTGGLLSGESAARTAREQVRSALAAPVGGRSPSSIGVKFDRDGELSFDGAAFEKALREDPAGTQAMVTAIASRLETAATGISDKYDGYLTSRVTSGEQTIKRLSDEIAGWDTRLATRRASLERTYAALEVSLAGLNSQSSWLASQLSAL